MDLVDLNRLEKQNTRWDNIVEILVDLVDLNNYENFEQKIQDVEILVDLVDLNKRACAGCNHTKRRDPCGSRGSKLSSQPAFDYFLLSRSLWISWI